MLKSFMIVGDNCYFMVKFSFFITHVFFDAISIVHRTNDFNTAIYEGKV